MKSSSASEHRRRGRGSGRRSDRWPGGAVIPRLLLLLLLGLAGSPPRAARAEVPQAKVQAVVEALEWGDVPEARRRVDDLLEAHPDDAAVQWAAARTAFYEGAFVEALSRLEVAVADLPSPPDDLRETMALYRNTVSATEDFEEISRDGIRVRYAPGVDRILVDEALEVMAQAREVVAEPLGGPPPTDIQVEIYPTVDRFVLASGLGESAVETTGVVALSKWSRLLMTSPRALALGYTWKDTVVHEYIHQVVSYRSHDAAPVWLQEGIARHLESWWRGERERRLDPRSQSLLAQALANDDLVTFEEMHPSLAFLPSAERATLAFAQVKVLVEFALDQGGEDTVARTLERVREGDDARQALAAAAGYPDFDAFYAEALEYLRSLELVERKLASLPTVLERKGEFAVDPVLARREDLAGYVRLGDLLHAADRPRAALTEYARAIPSDEPRSPLLANRIARALRTLERYDEALEVLESSAGDYPDFAPTHKHRGELLLREGRLEASWEAWRAAADINPFDPEVQAALATLAEDLGDAEAARRHARYLRILRTGGGVDED